MLAGRLVDNFDSHAFNFTRDKEEFLAQAYPDSVGVPTIGIGAALLLKSGGVYIIRSDLSSLFAGIHTFSFDELNVLQAIADEVNQNDDSGARSILTNAQQQGLLTFTLTDEVPGTQVPGTRYLIDGRGAGS
jgi:GH24 family phage-related lysozyme (muramidase)